MGWGHRGLVTLAEDWEFIAGYRENRLYINPASKNGAYAAIAQDNEIVLDEFGVGTRFRLAVTAFYVSDKADYSTYKIHKLQYRKSSGWFLVESVSLNGFQLEQIRKLNSIIASLDLQNTGKGRIDLGKISVDNLVDLLTTENLADISKKISESENLRSDIFALHQKREALIQFKEMIDGDANESQWQEFFESNTWIFGFGLKYVFLDRVERKFEAITSGTDFLSSGKRADGLARSRAKVSQFVLIEIKSHNTKLLRNTEYRPGVWGISSEVTNAVTQSQKTLHEFTKSYERVFLRDQNGDETGQEVYAIQPKTYLVVGSLQEVSNNIDKVACFELFRKSISAPELITFDELYYRAESLLAGLSSK